MIVMEKPQANHCEDTVKLCYYHDITNQWHLFLPQQKYKAKDAKYLNLILFHSEWTFRLSVELLSCENFLKSNMLAFNSDKTQNTQYLLKQMKKSYCNFCHSLCKNQFAFTKTLGQEGSLFREGIHRIIYILKCTSYHVKDECYNLFSMAQ